MGPEDKDFEEFMKGIFGPDGEPFNLGEFDFSKSEQEPKDDNAMELAKKTMDELVQMFYREGFNFSKSLELTMKVAMIFADIGKEGL